MKLIAFSFVLFTLAYSNCEPVKYAEKQKASQQKREEKVSKGSETTARVVGINDGDSIVVLTDANNRRRVRLATIDSPENHQAFGKPSKQSLSDLVYNKDIKISTLDVDRYGRIVGEVYIGDINVNLEQLRRGFAWHYKAHARQQAPDKRAEYAAAENEARAAKRGLWQETNPTPPWDYRNKNPRN